MRDKQNIISELKLLIIEDDISFATGVQMEMIALGFKNIEKAYTAREGSSMIENYKPDLVIVDIKLDQGSDHIHVSQHLKEKNIPFIVMTQFLDDLLYRDISRLLPLAYFTKPLDYTALKYVIETYLHKLEFAENKEDLLGNHLREYLYVRKSNRYLKVNFEDIIFVKSEGNYITLHTACARFIVRASLKKCLDLLPDKFFIRVHRNFVINDRHIDEFDSSKNTVLLKGQLIPVGRTYRQELKAKFKML